MSGEEPAPEATDQPSLEELRQHIDRIDDRIHDLLMERAQWVLQVGRTKGRGSPGTSFYRPEREARIHRRLEERHRGPFPVQAVHRIYREIISASLRLEKKLAVAYLGPEASSSHQAAIKQFGSSCDLLPVGSIEEVFNAVELERVDFGVAPVENSTEGVVTSTLDRFVESPLLISGEIFLSVVHNLLSSETDLKRVRTVYGRFSSLDRCRQWLDEQLPGVVITEVPSTIQAAERARNEPETAAIAGLFAADRFGLHTLAENIHDTAHENRYFVIGRQVPQPSGRDKTSLMFRFRDQPGFLHRVLGIFAGRHINLTSIQSRPSKRKAWDYLFFIDLEGHRADPSVAAALEELGAIPGVSIKILGSYPMRAL